MTWQLERRFCMLAAGLLLAGVSVAQTLPAGDGLLATYYEGEKFERAVLTRRDRVLDFQWALASPAPGVPAEHFSVRWHGWLVPPVSGRYVLHLRIDDGLRLWLNGRQLVNEWRDQYFSDFTTSVELQAGKAYELRIDYYQNALESRMRLAWERPGLPTSAPSWRNLWGWREAAPAREEVLSASYLFTRNPRPAPSAVVPIPTQRLAAVTVVSGPPRPRSAPAPRPRAAAAPTRPKTAASPARRPQPRPRPASKRASGSQLALPPTPADSAQQAGAAAVARLANQESVVLSALYFEQSKAQLLPAARRALDGLAAALLQHPTLRLQVQGHTDNQGSAELNRQLSQQRAEVVCLYLSAHGVPSHRLQAKGYGGTRPVADNNDPAQRPRNRRVVLAPQP